MSSAEAAVFDWYANLLPLVDMMCCCCAGTYSLCKFHDQNSVQFIVYKLLIYVQYWLFIYYWFTKSVSIKSWGIDMLLLLIGCSGRKSKPWTDMQIHAQYFKQALGLKQNHIWHHGWQHMLQVCFTTMMKMMVPCLVFHPWAADWDLLMIQSGLDSSSDQHHGQVSLTTNSL